MAKLVCVSTGSEVTNQIGSVTFPCPSCGKVKITRSQYAREIAAQYKCSNCGFTGPN
ncbi:DUF1610 domain-containing protein [Candidatus Woesearchaeota archaeon]|nr:DUF1610 domain-containing protein [Candidatus Woesearchaeota archaeon]